MNTQYSMDSSKGLSTAGVRHNGTLNSMFASRQPIVGVFPMDNVTPNHVMVGTAYFLTKVVWDTLTGRLLRLLVRDCLKFFFMIQEPGNFHIPGLIGLPYDCQLSGTPEDLDHELQTRKRTDELTLKYVQYPDDGSLNATDFTIQFQQYFENNRELMEVVNFGQLLCRISLTQRLSVSKKVLFDGEDNGFQLLRWLTAVHDKLPLAYQDLSYYFAIGLSSNVRFS